MQGRPRFLPCTPYGVQQLLVRNKIEIAGKHVVIVGRSDIVGKPMANMLLQRGAGADATVTVCHSRTADLPAIARQADILIVAIGRARFVTAEMVKAGAVVVDVGMNRVDGKLCGDVDYDWRARSGRPYHAGSRRRRAVDGDDVAFKHAQGGGVGGEWSVIAIGSAQMRNVRMMSEKHRKKWPAVCSARQTRCGRQFGQIHACRSFVN